MKIRASLFQLSSLCLVLATAFMFWKTLALVTNSPSPIVVVLSGSMEPAFQRGDVLFLWNREKYYNVGDIVVYNLDQRDIPIVHRVLREHKVIPTEEEMIKHEQKRKTMKSKKFRNRVLKPSQKLLTKGDNNPTDDLPLYGASKMYLDREKDLIGSVKGYIPKIGYVTIFITENVYFKYILIGCICISSLLSNE